MQKIISLLQFLNITVASIFIALFSVAQSYGVQKYGITLYIVIGIIVLVILLQLSQNMLLFFVRNCKFIRRLIFGKQFIEGHWFDHTIENKRVIAVGCITIEYKNESLSINGNTFFLPNFQSDVFNSKFTHFENDTLFYEFETFSPDSQNPVITGYVQLKFKGSSKQLNSYLGHLYDLGSTMTKIIQGERITDKKVIKELSTLKGRKRQASIYFKRINNTRNINGLT